MNDRDNPLSLKECNGRQTQPAEGSKETTDLFGLPDQLSDAEITRLFNLVMDCPLSPELRDRPLTAEEIAEAESPNYLEDDPPYNFRFPDQIELNARGIYETMYDTLPEMDLILANECIF